MPDTIPESETPQEAVYRVAYSLLGKHLTLNDDIPQELGCAQSLSFLLKYCGYPIPQGGISTVSAFTEWMLNNGFTPSVSHEKGAIITGRNGADAHIGIEGDTYVMSNTSYDDPAKKLVRGAFQANYSIANFKKAYPQVRRFLPPKVVS